MIHVSLNYAFRRRTKEVILPIASALPAAVGAAAATAETAAASSTQADVLQQMNELYADDDKVCVICQANPRCRTILPCRHFICCGECASLLTAECPYASIEQTEPMV